MQTKNAAAPTERTPENIAIFLKDFDYTFTDRGIWMYSSPNDDSDQPYESKDQAINGAWRVISGQTMASNHILSSEWNQLTFDDQKNLVAQFLIEFGSQAAGRVSAHRNQPSPAFYYLKIEKYDGEKDDVEKYSIKSIVTEEDNSSNTDTKYETKKAGGGLIFFPLPFLPVRRNGDVYYITKIFEHLKTNNLEDLVTIFKNHIIGDLYDTNAASNNLVDSGFLSRTVAKELFDEAISNYFAEPDLFDRQVNR